MGTTGSRAPSDKSIGLSPNEEEEGPPVVEPGADMPPETRRVLSSVRAILL